MVASVVFFTDIINHLGDFVLGWPRLLQIAMNH